MKVLSKLLFVGSFIALLSGCATDGPFVPELPTHAKAMYMDYQAQPENKVFVIAVDPSGDFAVGYEYGQNTKKEAYRAALNQCNENREAYGVLAKPYVYAINDNVVYEESISKGPAR